jgi:short-subunit dehydrogenase
MFEYHNAVAVVTGASSGIGNRVAMDLVARGAYVVGVARRVDEMARLSEARSCDLHDLEAWVALLHDVETSHGRIDVLVNGAGIERRKGIGEVAWDDVNETLIVNFAAAARAMVLVVPGMLARGHGAVLNISSDHGRAPGPGTPAYCASKAALSAFTESVAHEVSGTGVHLHVLYPGWVPTPLGQTAIDTGMPRPPKFVERTAADVSRLALDAIGKPGIEINAVRVAVLAPVVRALAPPLYRRSMRSR